MKEKLKYMYLLIFIIFSSIIYVGLHNLFISKYCDINAGGLGNAGYSCSGYSHYIDNIFFLIFVFFIGNILCFQIKMSIRYIKIFNIILLILILICIVSTKNIELPKGGEIFRQY